MRINQEPCSGLTLLSPLLIVDIYKCRQRSLMASSIVTLQNRLSRAAYGVKSADQYSDPHTDVNSVRFCKSYIESYNRKIQ